MKCKVDTVYRPDMSTKRKQPFFEAKVPAGFPSPAADYEEDKLDLNRHLIKNPASTFFVKVTGDSMEGAGIHHGDLLVVDRSLEPRDKNVVIAVINGELTVKRIRILFDGIDRSKSKRLMQAVDAVNARVGVLLRWAAEGLNQPWQVKFKRRSNCYTTRWDELPEVA